MLKELSIAFGIIGICLLVHLVGLVMLINYVLGQRHAIEKQVTPTRSTVLLFLVFATVVVLHVLEGGLWAVFYSWNGLFPNFETSLYFSLTSYSTIGYGDVLLPPAWRVL